MVNPTGYTALDLIGFTDKDAYSSSANYVKNDLVHYGGNIWRCLIDDTSGIAPAEGVNWTLFIGEPTNLVERIIAPVETDPATSAWAVGRQIIFNDNLYEVITAITAGDALVAYEDDPTNANIKLADPVETQLLNEESTRAAADLTLQNALTNRNLLDNPWFTVNQRGATTYTNGISVDRWIPRGTTTQVDVLSNGVKITNIQSTDVPTWFRQNLELSVAEALIGKTLTVSVMSVSGDIVSIPFTLMSINTDIGSDFTLGGITCRLRYEWQTTHLAFLFYVVHKDDEISLRAFKLELGSISTLAMDTAPNYAEELLKCQRYFYRYKANDSSGYMGMGGIQSTNNLRFILNLPTTMRQSPTITYSGSFNIADFGASNISTNITNITKQAFHGNSIVIIVQSSDTLVTATPAILKANSDANAYIDFSADL